MESKNFKLASSACLIGIGGAVLLGTVVKKQLEERKRERIKAELRQFLISWVRLLSSTSMNLNLTKIRYEVVLS